MTTIPPLYLDDAPREPTRFYFANGEAFGAPLAEPALEDDPAVGRYDLDAIAARAQRDRYVQGDEAVLLGAAYERMRDQLLQARMAIATLEITHHSYEELVAQWRAQDAAEHADLERRQREDEARSRAPLVLDDDVTLVIRMEDL